MKGFVIVSWALNEPEFYSDRLAWTYNIDMATFFQSEDHAEQIRKILPDSELLAIELDIYHH